jgi:hypothetical protein
MSLISSAQEEAKDSPKNEVGQEIYKKALGYWLMDPHYPSDDKMYFRVH